MSSYEESSGNNVSYDDDDVMMRQGYDVDIVMMKPAYRPKSIFDINELDR